MGHRMTIFIDRISPITIRLDEVVYKSSIQDMRAGYLRDFCAADRWILLSDYYFGDDKVNQVITFTALPLVGDVRDLQALVRKYAPTDIKHARVIQPGFISLLRDLPVLTFSFLFPLNKYLAWPNGIAFQQHMASYCDLLSEYVRFWQERPTSATALTRMSRNIAYIRAQIKQNKKVRILCQAFMIAILGGYFGGTLCRETALTRLCWMSDRDKTNELGNNLVRDLLQVTLIDIAKKNVDLSFTTANSNSEEWYADLTRIPDILTGAIAGFDFSDNRRHTLKPAAQTVVSDYLYGNRRNCFLYRFVVDDEGMRIQRVLIVKAS